MYKKLGILLVFAFFVIKMNAAYTCYYVSTTGTSTASGLSPASATNDLQKIFTQFQPGDTVKIAKGEYLTPANVTSFEIYNKWIQTNFAINVVLLGGWNNDFSIKNPHLNPTYFKPRSGFSKAILDIYRSNILIDGIIFQDGNSTVTQGGGINNQTLDGGFNMEIRNCVFRNNKTTNQGGGVCVYSYNGNWYSARNAFINCTFEGNSAVNGGGIHTNGAESRFYNCTFLNNFATVSGAAIHHATNGSDVLLSCTVVGNKSQQQGGGINSIASYIYNSIVAGNKCLNTPTLAYSDVQWAATDWGSNIFGHGGFSSSRSGSSLHATSAYVTTKDLYDLLDTISGNYASDERLFPGKLANNGGFTPTIKLKKTTVKRADGVIIPIDNHPYIIPTPTAYGGNPTVKDTVPRLDQTGRIRSANVCSGAYEYLDQEFTKPGFVANWKPERGAVEIDIDFYKYKQDIRFKHDLNVQDVIVEYTLDNVNYTALFILSSTQQIAQRGTQYRTFSVKNVNAGTQIQIWNKSSSFERWETITNATDYYQASAFSNSETFSGKINWQLPTELLGKKIYVRSRIAWTPMQYRQELISSPAGSPVAFTKQISIAEYGQIQTDVTSTVPQINTTAVWQNDGTVLYSINAPSWMAGFQYNIEENGKIIKTDYFSTKTFSFNYSSEDISKVKKYLTKAKFSPNSVFSNFPQYTINSNETVIKAYAMPMKIDVTMDGCTQKNTVSFDVPAVTDVANCETSNFELIRAEDESFNSGYKLLDAITYDASKTKYTYTDPEILGVNLQKTFYYKLRRVPILPEWGWNINTQVGNVIYNTTHKQIKVITVSIVDGKPYLKWDYSSAGVFCSGSKISIFRSQSGMAAQKVIELTDANIKTFTDDATLPTCIPLTYSLEIGSTAHGYTTVVAANKVLVPLSAAEQPALSYFKASKGYYNDRVELEWNLKQGTLNSFLIKRKLYEETGDKYVTIGEISATATKLYKYNDTQAVPSRYYSYLVIAVSSCNGIATETPLQSDLGFRMPTGAVSGRIVYNGDVPVQNADIIVGGSDQMKNKSVALSSGSLNIPDSTDILNQNGFALQTWLKLTNNGLTDKLIDKGSQFVVQRVGNKLQIVVANVTKDITGFEIPENTYFHISLVQNEPTSYTVYINGIKHLTLIDFPIAIKNKNTIVIKSSTTAFIDELRIWKKILNETEIANNYDRYISGKEDGLKAYYRFDENINEFFFDMSSKDMVFNENHGNIIGNCPRDEYNIPTSENLSLKGKTDVNGNYLIGGIPYFADGTSYTFTPHLGTHEFNPKQKPLFLGDKSAVQNNVDFTDISSFKYEGYVVYDGGNYPVEGVSFQIDDKTVVNSKGEIVETNNEGKYALVVPIGEHTIKAKKYGHTFSIGQISRNFQEHNLSGIEFKDATRIKLIGRIVGGSIESSKALLVGKSKNNIGQATIILEPRNADKYNMRNTVLNDTVKHDDGTLKKPISYKNTYKIDSKKITINTSGASGEFVAYVYPEDYTIKEVKTLNKDILGGVTGGIYLKNQLNKQYEINKWTDTIVVPAIGNQLAYKKVVEYIDSVMYNAKYIQTYSTDPEFSIKEINNKGLIKNYYGDNSYIYKSTLTNKSDTIPLVNIQNNVANYVFENPIYQQGNQYRYKINAYEKYVNDDNAVIDLVPVVDTKVLIDNTMKLIDPNVIQEIALDSTGNAVYTFQSGGPDLTTGLKKFDAYLQKNGRTYLWQDKFTPYLLGGRSTGNNFTTAGPNQLVAILRDPPGSNSYSYLEKGSVSTTTDAFTRKQLEESTLSLTASLGLKITTFFGLGGGVITEQDFKNTFTAGFHVTENYSWGNEKTTEFTMNKRYETSADPLWVGADADLFIGSSTNIVYGATNNISIIKKSEIDNPNDTLKTRGNFALCKSKGLAFGQTFNTEFAYTQRDLEQIFIPAWKELRNDIILPKGSVVDRNVITKPVYISLLDENDVKYGSNNSDKVIWGNQISNKIGEGPSYKIILPIANQYFTGIDSVAWCNDQIRYWKAVLASNEKNKLEASLINNQSFTSGAKFEYSQSDSETNTTSTNLDVMFGGILNTEFGASIMGMGTMVTLENEIGGGSEASYSKADETHTSIGFVMQESGDFDTYTVDYKHTKDGSISFNTRAGQSSCPYEGALFTKYYQPGTILNEATMKIENPKISVVNSTVSNVPANRNAVFELELKNESEAKGDAWYNLLIDGTTNPNGATLKIDGATINETGRTYLVKAGQILKKTLTLTKGPSALDYKNIRLILASTCQYDPTDFTEDIYDDVNISASFIPSCSEISLTAPLNNWVMNTSTGDTLVVKLENYDINTVNFGYIALQSKATSSSVWNEEMKFYASSTLYNEANGAKTFMDPTRTNIQYKMRLPYADNTYDVRAVAYCIDPTSKTVIAETPTSVATGIKDMVRPILFGLTQPSDGILNTGDEIQVQFNEDIAEGLVTHNNISVTGIKNGTNTLHTASVHFDGVASSMSTEQTINLSGKSFTFECWLKRNQLGKGTIMSHGGTLAFEFGFNQNNKLYLKNGSSTLESTLTYTDIVTWNHYSVVYDAETKKISAYVNGNFSISDQAFGSYSFTGVLLVGVNASQSNYLAADIHELRAWDTALDRGTISANKSMTYNGIELGMIGYWKMNEGKGKIAYDISKGRNANLVATWAINPSGKSVELSGINSSITLKTSQLPVSSSSDYTVEFWFKAAPQSNACLFSAGRGDGEEYNNSRNNAALWFNELGLLSYASNGKKIQLSTSNYLDNQWHHIAVSVNRLSTANFYVDGALVNSTDARAFTTFTASEMYLGMRKYMSNIGYGTYLTDMYFKGLIDEFRIWNTNLSESILNRNINTHLQGNEIGLAAYYPFDAYINSIFTAVLTNQVKTQNNIPGDTITLSAGSGISSDYAPVKIGNIPENLGFNFVTNKDKINITFTEQNSVIERTTVNVSVNDIQDKNGNNLASPISWDVYVDRSQLKWENNNLKINKAVNTELTFTTKINNSGASSQKYDITNFPTWMTVTPSYGTIKPNTSQEITFTVDKGLNIGAYDENLYLRSDYNEPLSLRVNVLSELPDWTVDPSKFTSSMNIIASLTINDLVSTDINDKIGIFINGVCSGVGQPVYYKSINKYLLYLKIYANDVSQNNKLIFKIFDASSGKIFSGKTLEPIYFINNDLKGLPSNPIVISAKDEIYQTTQLNNGWSWISVQVATPDLATVQTALSGMIAKSGDLIKDNGNGGGAFDAYSENTKSWNGSLTATGGLNNRSMYLIKSSMAQTLSIAGTVIDPTTVNININGQRWNYISYLPSRNITTMEALAGYIASPNDLLKAQNAFSVYDPVVGWIGDLMYLEPGKGYMLYRSLNTNTVFTYPANQTNAMLSRKQNIGEAQQARIEPGKYSETMNVIANVDYKAGLISGDWILGYCGAELVSANQLGTNISIQKPLIFVNLSAAKESLIHFELERDAKIIAKSTDVIQFVGNNVIGSLKSPYSLNFNSNTTAINTINENIGISTYPNPVDKELRLQINTNKYEKISIQLTDLLGKVIIETGSFNTIDNYFEKTMNIESIESGIYIVKINISGQSYMKKIIKK